MGKLTSKTSAKQYLPSKVKPVLFFSHSADWRMYFIFSFFHREHLVSSGANIHYCSAATVLLSLGLDVLSSGWTHSLYLRDLIGLHELGGMFCLEKILPKCSGCCSLILNETIAFQLFLYTTTGLVSSDTQTFLKFMFQWVMGVKQKVLIFVGLFPGNFSVKASICFHEHVIVSTLSGEHDVVA